MYQFKSLENFESKSSDICYIPENAEDSDDHYNYHDFVDMCNGNEEVARIVFDLCDWQSPGTVIEGLLMEEEIDEDFNIIPQE